MCSWVYESRDSDLTVLAYTGGGESRRWPGRLTYNGLVGAGWQFIGNYADAYDSTANDLGLWNPEQYGRDQLRVA